MKLYVMSIRDRATDSFGVPFFVPAIGQGVRSFTDEVNREAQDNQFNKHAEDFDLYVLGYYDQDTGLFSTDVPRQVAIGKDVKRNV